AINSNVQFAQATLIVIQKLLIHQTMLLGAIYLQDSKQAGHLLFKEDSNKEESYRELDRLINKLTRAEEKYLPLIEHGYPVKYVFTQIIRFMQKGCNLKNELIKNNKQIALFTERHKKLLDMYESLLKNHTTFKDDYDALLENNSDYYIEHCCLLEQENCVLNLELFEETEELCKEIEILFEEIEKLKKRNESLSCIIVIDD
ncbi:13005_t:CDS:2, partial [Gigaspora margarita]